MTPDQAVWALSLIAALIIATANLAASRNPRTEGEEYDEWDQMGGI